MGSKRVIPVDGKRVRAQGVCVAGCFKQTLSKERTAISRAMIVVGHTGAMSDRHGTTSYDRDVVFLIAGISPNATVEAIEMPASSHALIAVVI